MNQVALFSCVITSYSIHYTKLYDAEVNSAELKKMAERLKNVKKAEMMCGLRIERDDPILLDGDKLLAKIEETFATLLPLYKASF